MFMRHGASALRVAKPAVLLSGNVSTHAGLWCVNPT
jgi:hypothetical protein